MPHLTLKIPSAKTSKTVAQQPSKVQPDSHRKDSGQTDQASSSSTNPENAPQPTDHASPFTSHTPLERAASPPAPPYSPITPQAAAAQLATYQPRPSAAGPSGAEPTRAALAAALPQPPAMARPPPVPIDESTNADAIALRSAIALLQLQRDRSRRDIVALERARQAALRDPAGFVGGLGRAAARRGAAEADVLGPTLGGAAASGAAVDDADVEVRDSQDRDEEVGDDGEEEESDGDGERSADDTFPPLPTPQNVFRCPPINWAKYHIAGEPLDRLHEEQRQRPTLGEPEYNGGRAQPYVLAAPYSPLNDNVGVEHPMQTRKGSKKSA